MSDLSKLRLGTAPDSWGVWFPSDPHQVTWDVYLDEIAAVGYVYTELGPQGFMPQDPAQLKEELAQAQPHRLWWHGLRRPAQGQGRAGQGDRGVRPGGQAARRGRGGVPRAPAGAVHRPAHRCGHRGRRPRHRAVEEPGHRHRRAGQGALQRVRREAGLPPARRHPRRHPGPDRALPVRHRPRAGEPLPRHRSRVVLRGRQHRDHQGVPRAHHLRAPQVGRPRRPRPCAGGEDAALGVGQARHHVRAAVRRAGHAAAARRARRASTARSTP